MFIDGINIPITNVISKEVKDKFYISYDRSIFAYGTDTTALVIERYKENKGDLFFILKGDHRKNYDKCNCLLDCIGYYMTNEEYIHKYSDKIQLLSNYITRESE